MFTTTGNAPSPRASHTAVWTGTEMIVWGGAVPTLVAVQCRHRQLDINLDGQCTRGTGRSHSGLDWQGDDHLGWVCKFPL